MFTARPTLPAKSVPVPSPSDLCALRVSAFSSLTFSFNLLFARHSSFLSVRVSININPRHLRFLCFHPLTHSFALPKTLSPIVSCLSTLFPQNTREGVSPHNRWPRHLSTIAPIRLVSSHPYFITSSIRYSLRARRNPRNPNLFMGLLHNSRTPQGGATWRRTANPGCPLSAFTDHRPRATEHGSQNLGHYSPLTTHYSLPTP